MIIQIFRPPAEGETWQECKLGDINDVISFEYEPHFCGVGTFSLDIPITSAFAEVISVNTLLYSRLDGAMMVVKNILDNEQTLKITGYDLNCLLLDRLTMPRETGIAGADGKDVFSGTTEACVKHFVEYNMICSEDGARNYPRLAIAEDMSRGIAEDSNLVGMECLEDVVRTMCEGAGLGYRINPVFNASATEPLLLFDVTEQTDCSADQSERNRVVFSVARKNITSIQRETGISAEKNALWCETGGVDGFVFKGDSAPVSWDRREEYISLSVTDAYNPDEIQLFARKEMADKFAETDSLTVDAGNPLEYGTLYHLGDIVTVWDRNKSVQLDSVISAVHIKRSATEHTVKLTLGESKPKLLDGYARQTDILRKNQRDFPAVKGGATSSGALISYEYLSDLSATANGITYTAELDESGLISKITDSVGGAIEPVVSGEITDISFHNAIAMAVAMAKGLASAPAGDLMPYTSGIYGYFDYLSGTVAPSLWRNSMGGDGLALYGSTDTGEAVSFSGQSGSYGEFATKGDTDLTLYMVYKASKITTNDAYVCAGMIQNLTATGANGEIDIQPYRDKSGNYYINVGVYSQTWKNTTPSPLEFSVTAVRRSGTTLTVWTNDYKAGNVLQVNSLGSKLVLGAYLRGSGYLWQNVGGTSIKFVAIGNTAQSDDEVAANITYLIKRFGITN